MLSVTKIFRFEAAHAIHGYPGACANIHGHSYELHVSVSTRENEDNYIPGTGIVMDFKELKTLVQECVINKLDHQLILSKNFLATNDIGKAKALLAFEDEPTAENLLIFIRNEINKFIPAPIKLISLRLWETRDAYAEWSAG